MNSPELAGVLSAIAPKNGWTEQAILDKIQDDVDGEQEALPDLNDNGEDGEETSALLSNLEATVQNMSRGVTASTDNEYRSQMKRCLDFLVNKKLVQGRDSFFSDNPPQHAPFFICAWIMHECDTVLLDGKAKPTSQVRGSYSHAQKMRAAMTYAFGRIHNLGNLPWHKNSLTGKMEGNPSVSQQVSSYMVSLRRRKVQAGEAATSARAITPDGPKEILLKLHNFNKRPENNTIQDYTPGKRKQTKNGQDDNWGGARTRKLLAAAYILAFLCLLRVDEVLKIQCHHIEIKGTMMILTLPFRKTHQFGDIKPFHLYMMPPNEAHLCPVRALADWLHVSGINRGYVFRKMASGDRVAERDIPMLRHQINFWSYSETTSLMWGSTTTLMEPIHFDVEDVNIFLLPYDGHFAVSVIGGDGV